MQSDRSSVSPSQQSESQQSEASLPSDAPAVANTFVITREDAIILKEFVEEFQGGNTDVRTTIIAAAMAELRKVRPATTPFNKVEASKVSIRLYEIIWDSPADIPSRRLESGSTIITLNRTDNTSNSPTNGPLEIHSIRCATMKL